MAAFDQVAAQARQLDRQWKLTLERPRYETELARRRFTSSLPKTISSPSSMPNSLGSSAGMTTRPASATLKTLTK